MKKYNILVLITFCLLTLFLQIETTHASMPLAGKVIFLDAGHGGKDPGTVSGEVYEKDINLKIVQYLEEELIKYGATVYLTREGDYDLSSPNTTWRKKSDFDNRIALINNSNANMYLSVHLNYLNDARYSGAQVFYDGNNKMLAEVLQSEFNKELNSDREIKKIPSSIYMYNKLNIPGVLIECGFLSNSSEKTKLISEEYQKKIASIIAKAIASY